MSSLRNIAAIFLFLLFSSFGLGQVTDSHGGDFVVVTGTTTYESLPFIETFYDPGPGLEGLDDLNWVTAQWNSTSNSSDDFDCVDPPCGNTDSYISFLTPPDSFQFVNESTAYTWKTYNNAPDWSAQPVAYFRWSQIQNYSMSMYSPLIIITNFTDLKISFDMYFDAYPETETNEYIDIDYSTGSGWENALTFLADVELGAVDIPWGNNSFFINGLRDLDTLQIRFRTYGSDAYNIDYWYIDNVKVYGAPVLSTVSISGPAENPGGAINGDVVTISMETNTDLIAAPTVIMNGEFVTSTGSGTDYTASKTISDADPTGPVLFSIDFMSTDTIAGQTVTQTTDNSKVIIDRFGPSDYETNDIIPDTSAFGGNVIDQIWNSTNTSLNVTLTLPPDTAISGFNVLDGWSRFYNDQSSNVTSHGTNGLQLNALTLEVWTKVQSADTYDGMVAYGEAVGGNESGYGFVYYNGLWRFFLVTGVMGENAWESNPATSIQNGVWTHLAGTYDGSVIKLYKDGVLVNSSDQAGNVDYAHVSLTQFFIGKFKNDASFNYFHGQISEVRVWNYARSQEQISGFRSWTLNGDETGLVSYWKMAEGTGTVLTDNTGNSNGTCPASGWMNNAPPTLINPDLLEPEYNYEALVGANVKLRASINGGDYMDFGENNQIIQSDLSGQMTANASADYLETIPGFVEGAVLRLETKLIDIAGNETIGTPSNDTLLVKQDLNSPNSISIASNNGDTSYAKIENTVTVSFTTAEAVNTPIAMIQGNNATVTNNGNDYSAAYQFVGGETNGPVTFSITYTDLYGNPDTVTAVSNNSAVIYDDVTPTVTVTTYSSNSYNNNYAKLDDRVYVRIDASERLRSDIPYMSATILDHDADATLTSSNNDSTFTAYIVVVAGDQEGQISFSFTYEDFAGNGDTRTTTNDNSSVICDLTPPADYVTGAVVPTGGTIALRFWNSTNTGLNVTIPIDIDSTLAEGIAHPYVVFNEPPSRQLYPPAYYIQADHLGTDYTITFADSVFEGLTGFVENATVTVEFHSKIWDAPHNQTDGSTSASILKIDQTPPNINCDDCIKMIYSSNDDKTRAILGDTVYVQFTGESEGIDTVAGNIGGQAFDGYDHRYSFTSRVWRRMTGAETEGVLPFSITAGDTARNMSPIYTDVDDGSSVDFSAAGPEILLAKISSNSSYGDTLAKPGDSIIVEIRTDMPISLDSDSAVISGQTAVSESPSSNRYLYNIIAADDDQDGIVQFAIDYTDLNGNSYSNITTTTDGSYVRFDGTDPVFPVVSISSTGADSTIAGASDTINLTFRIHEAVSDSSVIILNNPANSITALNNNYYRATYTITGSESEGRVRFNITAVNLVGNSASIDSTSNNSYVVFDQTPPSNFTVGQVISDGGMVVAGYWNSTNQNILVTVPIDNDSSLIDGAVQVLVSFDGSDTLEVGDPLTIDSVNTDETISIRRIDFVNSQYYSEGASALFTARINDFAGYTRIGTSSSNQLQIDLTGPSVDSIAIKSNNYYNDQGATWYNEADPYGDIIYLYFRVQEEIITPTVIIEGDTADTDEFNINVWEATKEMDTSDVEGNVNFSFTPRDLAGNPGGANSQTTDGSRVIFDYTAPFINYINEGGVTDKDYTASTDSLRLVMDGGDLISGIYRYYFALSTDSVPDVSTPPIPWDEAYGFIGETGDTSLTGITLLPGTEYFGKAYAMDGAGNTSDIIVGNGITVDTTAPSPGTIIDGFDLLNDSIYYTIDSTRLDVRWQGFSDMVSEVVTGKIGSYELSVFYEDTIEVLDWFTVDTLADSAAITGLALQRNTEYFVKIRAVDMAGNKSDTAKTNGIQFDNQPAKLDTIMPSMASYLDVSTLQTINFKFNKKLFSYKFSLDNIGADTLPYNISHSDSTVTVALTDTLLAADTLYFNFDSVTSLNRLVMDETITLYSMLWGDLDSNRVLDVADVVRFNTLWPNVDIAPVEHEPPHYAPNLDGEANLRDLSIFSRMWNWYYKTYIPTMLMTSGNNVDVSATYSGGQLRIQLPENTSAGQIIFTDLNYDIINVSGASSSAQRFVLVNEDSVIGVKAYTFGSFGGALDSVFVINVNLNTETDYSQGLQVRFYDREGKEILAGTALLKITPVPARYALGQNYPNPFNPTTTIRFELPVDAHTRIAIYDLLGREIIQLANKPLRAGYHQVVWQGRDTFGNAVPSGMYFYRMEANGFSSTRKMVFLK